VEEGLEASTANGGWKAARCMSEDMHLWYTVAIRVTSSKNPPDQELIGIRAIGSNNLGGL
jgi:hypothetical protein